MNGTQRKPSKEDTIQVLVEYWAAKEKLEDAESIKVMIADFRAMSDEKLEELRNVTMREVLKKTSNRGELN